VAGAAPVFVRVRSRVRVAGKPNQAAIGVEPASSLFATTRWLRGTVGGETGDGVAFAPGMAIGVVTVKAVVTEKAATTHGHAVGGTTTVSGTAKEPFASA
jgi:hypothetical protein